MNDTGLLARLNKARAPARSACGKILQRRIGRVLKSKCLLVAFLCRHFARPAVGQVRDVTQSEFSADQAIYGDTSTAVDHDQ
jgi:hypothetical protein